MRQLKPGLEALYEKEFENNIVFERVKSFLYLPSRIRGLILEGVRKRYELAKKFQHSFPVEDLATFHYYHFFKHAALSYNAKLVKEPKDICRSMLESVDNPFRQGMVYNMPGYEEKAIAWANNATYWWGILEIMKKLNSHGIHTADFRYVGYSLEEISEEANRRYENEASKPKMARINKFRIEMGLKPDVPKVEENFVSQKYNSNDSEKPTLTKSVELTVRKLRNQIRKQKLSMTSKITAIIDSARHICTPDNKNFLEYCAELTYDYLNKVKVINKATREVVCSLADLKEGEMERRFAQLYAISIGITNHALSQGLTCYFVTITLPGEFHRNPKYKSASWEWNGVSIEECSRILSERTHSARMNAKKHSPFMGLAVKEPHGDGTPHMHEAVFTSADAIEAYARSLRLNGFTVVILNTEAEVKAYEQGVKSRKVKTQNVVIKKWIANYTPNEEGKVSGSPMSYLFKYLQKSVGFKVDDQTTKFWAQEAGIRTFNFFGLRRGTISLWESIYNVRKHYDKSTDTEVFPEDFPEHFRKIWDLMHTRKYAQALHEIDAFSAKGKMTIRKGEDGVLRLVSADSEYHNVLETYQAEDKSVRSRRIGWGCKFGTYIPVKEFTTEVTDAKPGSIASTDMRVMETWISQDTGEVITGYRDMVTLTEEFQLELVTQGPASPGGRPTSAGQVLRELLARNRKKT